MLKVEIRGVRRSTEVRPTTVRLSHNPTDDSIHTFFLRGKIVLDVESFSNFLWSLALNHVCNSFASSFQERLDVKIICSKDDFKEHFLVDVQVLLIPFGDVLSGLLGSFSRFLSDLWVILVVFTVLNDLLEDVGLDLWELACRLVEYIPT